MEYAPLPPGRPQNVGERTLSTKQDALGLTGVDEIGYCSERNEAEASQKGRHTLAKTDSWSEFTEMTSRCSCRPKIDAKSLTICWARMLSTPYRVRRQSPTLGTASSP